ncbi:Hypothetical protein HVR_LOCUS959 [uncultured virus]|nr:Hypothetical protein HVR_LOCUS959 [uncultured virus]
MSTLALRLHNSLTTTPKHLCVAQKQDGQSCRNKAKQYRVCGIHKSQAIDGSLVPGFEADLEILRKFIRKYKSEAEKLADLGIDILEFQYSGTVLPEIMRGDLTNVPQSHMPMMHTLKDSEIHIKYMMTRYDPNLVSNNADLIRELILNPQ